MAVVGMVVAAGMVSMVLFYASEQENSIMAQNERAVRKVTESVIHGLEIIMLAGYADIAQDFAASLKSVPEVHDFRILRKDGSEAFQDNKTVLEVNAFRGEDYFYTRDEERLISVLPSNAPQLIEGLRRKEMVLYYENDTGRGKSADLPGADPQQGEMPKMPRQRS